MLWFSRLWYQILQPPLKTYGILRVSFSEAAIIIMVIQEIFNTINLKSVTKTSCFGCLDDERNYGLVSARPPFFLSVLFQC